ncbi:25487_t:CDS:2, partial [Racocetra persica]
SQLANKDSSCISPQAYERSLIGSSFEEGDVSSLSSQEKGRLSRRAKCW